MKTCLKCGGKFPDDAMFCSYCGFEDVKFCRDCGKERIPGTVFCAFCGKNSVVSYKDAATLRKYISESGKILPRRITGTCATHQREVTNAVKRARHMAILPFTER